MAKVCGAGVVSAEGMEASEALFSTLGVPAGRSILRGRNPCFSMRYCWMDDFPAQMPKES